VVTRTPISIEVRPVRFTLAWKVTSSPTCTGSRKTTWSTESVTA
jgi:hypothetical protein